MRHTKEVLWKDTLTPALYLQELYHAYPYDIEESIVYSLLEEEPILCPALWDFIEYARHVHKYFLYEESLPILNLQPLLLNMCQSAQHNHMVLYTHQFQLDASLHCCAYAFHNPYAHLAFENVQFVDKIHLHIPSSLDVTAPKEHAIIQNVMQFPYRDLSFQPEDFLALSIQIADQHGILFLPKTQIGLVCACASLYQICEPQPHNDFFLLYGIANKTSMRCTYYDATNEMYIGLVMGEEDFSDLESLKTMVMTLFNSTCLRKHDYPLHASMVIFHFPQRDLGIVLAGEENSGKSEIMDALIQICDEHAISYTKIFDDQGTLHYLDNEVVATGTEIGAYIHGDALPRKRLFQQISSSVMVREPDSTHFLTPFTTYEETRRFHKVDLLLYLDNYTKTKGLRKLEDLEEAFAIFHAGRHRKHGAHTPSYSPFFNPLGLHQNEELASTILHQFLSYVYLNSIYIGILSTRCSPAQKEHAYQQFANLILNKLKELYASEQ